MYHGYGRCNSRGVPRAATRCRRRTNDVSAYHKNALPPGYMLAEYAIEAVLGHGGFGITYLARDTSLGALVAIKEYLPHDIAARGGRTDIIMPKGSPNAVRDYHWGLKNFVKEARALARFKHPNIVRVLRFLEANGTAYTVMEYEEGTTLAEHLKQNGPRLNEPTLLRIFIPILNGLHAVHEAGMLHLDIKPANIYLRKDGRPMLIDFGSARQAITGMGQAQRTALTRGYAPIEQYPDRGKPDPRTDIYSLGASMYRCVSGKNPAEAIERYRAILDYKVDPLAAATKVGAKHYQGNLLKCIDWAMQIYSKDRPRSAREFQESLMGANRVGRRNAAPAAANTAGPSKAVLPAPIGRSASAPSRTKRRAFVGWLGSALGAAALLGAGAFYWSDLKPLVAEITRAIRLDRNRPPPPAQRATRSERGKARPTVVGREKRTVGKEVVARASKPRIARVSPPAWALARTLVGHKDWVQSVAFSPDGRWLASGSNDTTINVWDAETGALRATLRGHGYAVNATAISADDKWLASAGIDGTVRLWDLATGAQRGALRGYGYAFYALAFSPDAKVLAAAGKDRAVFLWDVESGKQLHALEGHDGDVYAVAFSPEGKTVASAGADRKVIIWDVKTGLQISSLIGHPEQVLCLAYSRDGRLLASGDAGNSIRLWAVPGGTLLHTFSSLDHAVLSITFSPDGRWLAAGSADDTIRIVDADTGAILQTLRGHNDYVQSVALSPDGSTLASGSRDNSVKLWNMQ